MNVRYFGGTVYCNKCEIAYEANFSFCGVCGSLLLDNESESEMPSGEVVVELTRLFRRFNKKHNYLSNSEYSLVGLGEILEIVESLQVLATPPYGVGRTATEKEIDSLLKQVELLNSKLEIIEKVNPSYPWHQIFGSEDVGEDSDSVDVSDQLDSRKSNVTLLSGLWAMIFGPLVLIYVILTLVIHLTWDWMAWAVPLTALIGFAWATSLTIKCPNCEYRQMKASTHKGNEHIGSRDGWHTVTEAVQNASDYYDNHGKFVGQSNSTSYVNRSVPHTDHFYLAHFECEDCGFSWSTKDSRRES